MLCDVNASRILLPQVYLTTHLLALLLDGEFESESWTRTINGMDAGMQRGGAHRRSLGQTRSIVRARSH
jgi:hypothetical protein